MLEITFATHGSSFLTITTICSNGDSLPLVLPLRLAPAILLQWRGIFLMNYLVTVEEAVGLGTKIVRRMLPSGQAIVNSFSLWMASENLAASLLFSASQ